MNKLLKSFLFFLLGLLGVFSLFCSIAANGVTNEALIRQGFLSYAQTAHLNVPPTAYEQYAKAISGYLDGKSEVIQVTDPGDASRSIDAFSEKENRHLQDVRGIVTFLKAMRWIGGGGTAAVIAALYLFRKKARGQALKDLVQGFAFAAMAVLAGAVALGVWGVVNFQGLFWTFHQVIFTNDLWLLDPNADLLVALMPIQFFTWYAGELLKSMMPVIGMLLLLVIAYFKIKGEEKRPAEQ